MKEQQKIITGNVFDKYGSKNPIYQRLMSNFTKHLFSFVPNKDKLNCFEIGIGEGLLAKIILEKYPNSAYIGIDLDDEIVNEARENTPEGVFDKGSVYDLEKYYNQEFDVIIVSEVLEHLEYPEKALQEISKLKFSSIIFTVPNEPIWRILNVMRLKYLKDFGNTPGHLQHWGTKSFKTLIAKYFTITNNSYPFPWQIIHVKK